MKMVILSKSCSRCGGSTISKGQNLQKSVRRATPNGNVEKNQQKSLPAPSPDALFRSRARFLSISCSRPGPKIVPKPSPAKVTTSAGVCQKLIFRIFVARARSGGLPERFWRLRGPSQTRFSWILSYFFGWFRRDLVGVCRVPPGCCQVAPFTSRTHSAGFLWGTAILRSDLNSPYPAGVLAC